MRNGVDRLCTQLVVQRTDWEGARRSDSRFPPGQARPYLYHAHPARTWLRVFGEFPLILAPEASRQFLVLATGTRWSGATAVLQENANATSHRWHRQTLPCAEVKTHRCHLVRSYMLLIGKAQQVTASKFLCLTGGGLSTLSPAQLNSSGSPACAVPILRRPGSLINLVSFAVQRSRSGVPRLLRHWCRREF